jgi:cell division protein ZapB
MISEFQDLSDKIDRLAQLTQSLRAENYLLRQANTLLSAENLAFKERLIEAQRRVEALLDELPKPPDAPDAEEEPAEDASVADASVADASAQEAPRDPNAPIPPHLAHAQRQGAR